MIRIDSIWLAMEPMDMRAGTETALARVIAVFGAANQIRPWALGRKNWLFAGLLRSGKRAAAIMTLIQSARLNGHDPYDYLKDVLMRLPTQPASEIDQLLLHSWQPISLRKALCKEA